MSKKLFSLIYGDKLHVAPKTKVLPADDYSKLVDAEEVLAKVKEEADKYREQVTSECEQLKETAQKEGFEAGFKKWAEHIASLEQQIIDVRKDLEKVLVPVALKASKKIVGRELEQSEQGIVDIVSNVLKTVSQHKKIVVYVSKKDYETLEKNRNKLKQLFESLESLSIRPREDIGMGGCVIETEAGIINAQLDNQWQTLEKAFENILKAKKEV